MPAIAVNVWNPLFVFISALCAVFTCSGSMSSYRNFLLPRSGFPFSASGDLLKATVALRLAGLDLLYRYIVILTGKKFHLTPFTTNVDPNSPSWWRSLSMTSTRGFSACLQRALHVCVLCYNITCCSNTDYITYSLLEYFNCLLP